MSLFPEDATPRALATVDWTATRGAGLRRLEAFLPQAGRAYASGRNTDRGSSDRSNVSALSPWIRRRLLTEEEVIAAVLKRHRFEAAEKFIQEVCWRSYWKGWLEMRPGVLRRFNGERIALQARLAEDRRLRRDVDRALAGATGIACFDAWAQELEETGWLHNHTRMWFASIWIFTLGLPWQLGADAFYKRLLDADPASNTLSWRWVAGLHTRGKHYLARAENIRAHTLGRFDPRGELDERALPLSEDEGPPPVTPLPPADAPPAGKSALLLTEEDLHPESLFAGLAPLGVAALASPAVGAPDGPAALFGAAALADGLARAAGHFAAPAAGVLDGDEIIRWARDLGVETVVTAYAPTGLLAWELDKLQAGLARAGLRLARVRRRWDERAWPHATAGFFKLKERIPALVRDLA